MLDAIENLFAARGAGEYHGEAVSQLEHALQAAALAESGGGSPSLIAAALLHDIGHLLHGLGEHAADLGVDDAHEELGYRYLLKEFGPAVSEPVRLHVAAKRYLAAAEPGYRAILSPASELSLQLQGGPMADQERVAFEREPHYADALMLRRYDDAAKVPGLATPTLQHFLHYLESARAR